MKSGSVFERLSHSFEYGRTTVQFMLLVCTKMSEEDREEPARAWDLTCLNVSRARIVLFTK